MILPIILALGVIGIVYSTRRKDIPGGAPIPVPKPEEKSNIPSSEKPSIPIVPSGFKKSSFLVAPNQTLPDIRYKSPIFMATDITRNCKQNETWIPITDPRIALYPHMPITTLATGEKGICVLTAFLP